jgi:hypothetical protein
LAVRRARLIRALGVFACVESMKHPENVTVESLPFPVSFGEIPCLVFHAREQEVFARFGEPHERSKENEVFGEAGPCVYWAFGYSCGLEVAVKYHLFAEWVEVAANEFDVRHILQHLDMPTPNLWKMDVNGSEQLSY